MFAECLLWGMHFGSWDIFREHDKRGHDSQGTYTLERLGVGGQETNEQILVNEQGYDNNKTI